MYQRSNVICPHLIGSPDGATCSIANEFIRNMEDADIRLCMNRRYEACSIYKSSLIKMAAKSFLSDAVPEAGQ
ncbi:MAG: hypothetical protein HZC12_08335 [Nitrospirae bacterium]|nr:hypothetical protein [Nitrospirota bacterium]